MSDVSHVVTARAAESMLKQSIATDMILGARERFLEISDEKMTDIRRSDTVATKNFSRTQAVNFLPQKEVLFR